MIVRNRAWRVLRAVAVAAALMACVNDPPNQPTGEAPGRDGTQPPVRVLMLTATTGFRHDSIGAARTVMSALSMTSGEFTVTMTEDVSGVTSGVLADYDIVCFCLTTGELPFTADQKAAILAFVTGGKGFLGIHSASDTLYEWPEYGRLIGAYFKEHPWTQQANVVVENGSHPATSGLGASFSLLEEFYTFRENPRPTVDVLLRLDASSVGAIGDFPLAWAQAVGGGRSYYNALGHFDSTWASTRFQQQMLQAIRWLAKRS